MKWIWLNQSTALWYDAFEPEGNAGELVRIYRPGWPHGRITRGAGLVLFPQTITFGRLTKRANEESDAPTGVVVESRVLDELARIGAAKAVRCVGSTHSITSRAQHDSRHLIAIEGVVEHTAGSAP
jgi:hypothetical protein